MKTWQVFLGLLVFALAILWYVGAPWWGFAAIGAVIVVLFVVMF
ncbi:hypothetical protein ACQZ4X_21780 [Agrobacterium vitis]|nr:hypothetical protein [Agrobacterium vitis]